ncbi:unnamed protein product [Mytilus coruscus]|uniref:Mab-21-like HhH/H2TH-like domain-containing protein n=1 Tax=Mytilus coruscus TaxID=42192 RepID=A0A6J8A9Q7_MYTCO|nr:unnamed protein product [Mytilus coruscus]
MNRVCDNLSCSEQIVPITSGSFGEGQQMCGSDLDIMYVSDYIEVHDNTTPIVFNPSKTYFSMMTDDTKPENNLFENRIEGLAKDDLIDTLRELLSYGWRCILFSKQLSFVSGVSCNVQHNPSILCYEDINKFLKSKIFYRVSTLKDENNNFSKAVYNIMSCSSKKLKYSHAYFMSALCNYKCQSIYLSSTISNKIQYKQHNTCLSYLLMNINHDTVSGWLMLASYFYKKKQYEKSLIIILYALSKCTLDKLFRETEFSVMQCLLVKWYLEQNQGVVRSLKFILADYVTFGYKTFFPMELIIRNSFLQVPPVVHAHFLSFLCHYHLNNVREYRRSLRDLQLTIAEKYFIGDDSSLKAASYYCLGTVLKTMRDLESANQAFIETVKLLH